MKVVIKTGQIVKCNCCGKEEKTDEVTEERCDMPGCNRVVEIQKDGNWPAHLSVMNLKPIVVNNKTSYDSTNRDLQFCGASHLLDYMLGEPMREMLAKRGTDTTFFTWYVHQDHLPVMKARMK